MYRITAGDYTYIGSTKDLKQRKTQHKTVCNNTNNPSYILKVYQMIREVGGWDNCEMVPIEEYECENSTQARIREEHWRREYNANMNSCKAYITKEEQIEQMKKNSKKNYEENKETIKAKHREYRLINNEKHRERSKVYREANKERDHAKHTCECGGKYTHMHIRTHEKSKKHLDYLAKTLSIDTL